MPERCFHLPPSFEAHVLKGNYPHVYLYLWGIGALCVVIVACIILPHANMLRRKGMKIREKHNDLWMPRPYFYATFITCYPVVLTICKFCILLSPVNTYTLEFISHVYEGIAIFLFTELLSMLLGGTEKCNMIASLTVETNNPPTKYWSVLPLCCIFRPCEKKKHINKSAFYIIYLCVIQYSLGAPLMSFIALVKAAKGHERDSDWSSYLTTTSAGFCIYGLFAYMRVSRFVLAEFKPRGKFFSIKSLVLAQAIPYDVMLYFNLVSGINDEYTDVIMMRAYSCAITLSFAAGFCWLYHKFYTVRDCRSAMVSVEAGVVICKRSMSVISEPASLRAAYKVEIDSQHAFEDIARSVGSVTSVNSMGGAAARGYKGGSSIDSLDRFAVPPRGKNAAAAVAAPKSKKKKARGSKQANDPTKGAAADDEQGYHALNSRTLPEDEEEDRMFVM